MAIAARNQRPPFEEDDFDDVEDYPQFGHITGGPNLPPVEFKVEEIADSATPEEMIRAAMEDRLVETTLGADTSFGPVAIPAEKSLYGYKYALGNSGHNIQFSGQTYGIFDGIIIKECGGDENGNSPHAAFNPRMTDYSHYSPLRRNIAILRNYLMAIYPPAGNKMNQATLKAMAERLGKALYGEQQKLSLIQRIIWAVKQFLKGSSLPESNRFLALSNTPDRGIAFMYNYIREQQLTASFAGMLPAAAPPKDWKLLPLEETPFSSANMARHSDASRMGQIAAAFDLVVRHLNTVEDMKPKDKEISVDHARDILKNLRIIMTGAREEKQYDEMDPRCREAQDILLSALGFQSALAELAKGDPDVLNDPLVIGASKAIVKMHSRVRVEEQVMQKQEQRAETTTQPQPQQSQSKPSRSKSRGDKPKSGESINKMMFKFEEGATRVGEIRRQQRERARQRAAALSKAIGSEGKLKKNLNDGQSTMSNPKIHQVSLNDSEFVENVKRLNEERAEEAKKAPPGGQTVGRK